MIHILNFNDEIIDFISRTDNAVIQANYERDKSSELLDLIVLSKRAEHFKKRNRVIIEDINGVYREFIIERTEENGQYLQVECTASYVPDISTAKPIMAGKYEKMTVDQKLSEVLRDTNWSVGDCDYGGIRSNSWTSPRTPYEMISQLTTNHKLEPDYEIIIEGNEVKQRLVNMKIPSHLFKGKEIVYGKDLLSIKRTVDFSEVKTALIGIGPEKENGDRIFVEEVDDEAQQQFNLPQRYIYGIYEPETEDDNMTLERLRTLTRTELNKRKSAAISYEISVVDLEKEYPHEIIRFGDIIRIKNPDFTPSLYAESEVIGFKHDLISGNCTYTFGNIIEYKEETLRKYFESKLDYIRQKLNDGLTNVNTIVADVVEGKLEYFERKIIKGVEPPENPVNDMLWLDTSNSDVAVLRRYWEGQWINATAEKAEDIGAITREKALYSELTNTFVNLSIQHSKLLNEMHDVINSEYLVDFDLKDELNAKLDATVSIYNNIKSNLESMTDETATIGKLIDTQTLFLNYRTAMQNLYKVVERAKVAIDERFKLLQSQYTEEKFRDALQEIADKFGLQVNEQNQLEGEPNVVEKAVIAAREDTKEQLMDYVKSVDYQTNQQGLIERMESADAERKTLAGQISDRVTKSEYQSGLDNIKIGGVNLFQSYDSATHGNNVHPSITSTQSFRGKYWATTLYTADYLKKVLVPGEEYTYSYELEIVGLSEKEVAMSKNHGIIFYSASNSKESITSSYKQIERIIGNKFKVTQTFVAPKITDHKFLAYSGFYSDDGTVKYPVSSNLVEFRNLKLEKGNKATDYTEAPSDVTRSTDKKLTVAKTEILQDGEQISQRVSREVFNASSQTLNRVVSEFINNTTSGMTFTYDENGNIQSQNIGPQGIKFDATKFEINDGDVVVKNGRTTIKDAYIDKLFSNQATINKLNSIDIDARRIRASDNQASVNVEGGTITMNRTDGAKLDIGLDGIAMYNSGGSKRFSMDKLLVESAALGTSNSNVYLAASDGFEARVVDRAMVPSDGSISSYKYLPIRSLALKFPQNSNGYVGVDGEFRIMSEGLVNGVYRDLRANGIYANRLISNDSTNLYLGTDSNVRLVAKGDDNVYRDLVANGVYADFVQINPNTSSSNLYLRASGEVRMTALGSTTSYQNVRANGFLGTFLDVAGNTNASNMYVRPAPGGALCVTQRNTTDKFLAVKASQGIWTSSEKYKENIDEWDENVLQKIKDTKLYEYDLMSEKDTPNQRRHHGVIIERQTPKEWVVEDGVDQYEMTTWSLKAIQELLVNIELMDKRIKKLEVLQNERTS
ncbi:phage tail spike protein [Staphylococcus chromogenes]|uniref:phage tail spike protein n=2 Tax=Staphylococcus chromogenes TaxID=46126 RepID=UPI000D03354D|nr:phage tail spike protein [Staphylococcus chromogenes]MCD9070487.1 tail fiber domain-containing protein [Staphylococcus chromogenes]